MRWWRAGRSIGQAVKNVGRLKQVLAVFAKYGYADIVERMNLGRYLPASWDRSNAGPVEGVPQTPQERLRVAFEELGPTFVKLGQLLSTRSDLLPQEYIDEFAKLQDNVQTVPFERMQEVLESELKGPWQKVFSSLNPVPLAAASIGQVYEATLLTGEKVVIKLQRPDIKRVVDTDVSLLAFLARLLERTIPESRIVRPTVVVNEFFSTLQFELDYRVEANNTMRIAENLASYPDIVVPKVYPQFSSEKVLILEKLEGIRVSDVPALDAAGVDRKAIVEVGARAFFKTVLMDGVFHGDLHGGNLFVLPGNRLGIIDFGIVGRLSRKSRDLLANMLISLISEDYENLCYQYAELSLAGPGIDFDGFQREVQNILSPYMGLPLDQLNIGKILMESTRIATKYSLQIPGEWMIVFKAILTIEGMGRTLHPGFDLVSTGQDLVKDLVKNQYAPDRLMKDLMWVAKDTANLLQILPRQMRWMLRKLNNNDFALEIRSPELKDLRRTLDLASRRQSRAMVAVGLLISGAIAQGHLYELSLRLDRPLQGPVFHAGWLIMALGLIMAFTKRG